MLLCIYGCGGLGAEVAELSKQINEQLHRWDEIIFLYDYGDITEKYGHKVYSPEALLSKVPQKELEAIVAVGEPYDRMKLLDKLDRLGINLTTLVHPGVHIPGSTVIERGTIVGQYAFISVNITIGENTLIQNSCSIGHDTRIGKCSVISAFDTIAGKCCIGDLTYIAPSVAVKDRISIGTGSIIGMGSTVQRDIPDNVIAIGNPARPMKNNDERKVFK